MRNKYNAVRTEIDGLKFDSKVCPHCGETFTKKPGQQITHWKTQRFCTPRCGSSARVRPVRDRFWEKIDKRSIGDCWHWQAASTADGYGLFDATRLGMPKSAKAHRVSFFLARCFLPEVVMHTCDNPSCVNPNHLVAGTHKDNVHDMYAKGRNPDRRGEASNFALLTESDVLRMRHMFGAGASVREVADKFGARYHAAWNVCHGRTWRHLL